LFNNYTNVVYIKEEKKRPKQKPELVDKKLRALGDSFRLDFFSGFSGRVDCGELKGLLELFNI